MVYAELTEEGLRLAKRSEAMYREQLRIHLLGALSEAEISQLDVVGQALANAYPRAVNEGRDEIVRTERSPDLPTGAAAETTRLSQTRYSPPTL